MNRSTWRPGAIRMSPVRRSSQEGSRVQRAGSSRVEKGLSSRQIARNAGLSVDEVELILAQNP